MIGPILQDVVKEYVQSETSFQEAGPEGEPLFMQTTLRVRSA